MKLTKLLPALLFLAQIANAQQRYELTVKDAVDLAYKNAIELKNAQIDYRIQEAKNREILGQAYPQLSGNVSASHYIKLPGILFPDATSSAVYQILKDEGVSGSGGPITNVPAPVLRQVSFQQPWNLSVGGTLTQLLFQPDVFVGLQARETALSLSSAQLEQARDRIKDSAYKRYYAILIVQKQLEFLDSSMVRLRKMYHDDSLMLANGFAERLDLDRVQVQINNLEFNRNNVLSALELSYAGLKFALGLSQADTVVLRDDLNSVNIRDNLLQSDFRYEDRPEIRTLGFARRLQELDVKRNRLGFIPTVSASANYSVNGQGQKFFTDKNTTWINSSFIGLNVNVPIFDGFQRRYRTEQARLKLEQVDNNITLAKQGIDLEQTISRQTLLSSVANLDIQERNMELATRVYNVTDIKYKSGLATTSFEVIQAYLELQTAQANYFSALYNAVVARINYLHSIGKLQ